MAVERDYLVYKAYGGLPSILVWNASTDQLAVHLR